jgi:hypothetical protein
VDPKTGMVNPSDASSSVRESTISILTYGNSGKGDGKGSDSDSDMSRKGSIMNTESYKNVRE